MRRAIIDNYPGLALAAAVTVVAFGIEWVEALVTGYAWLDSLVIALLLGTAIHTALGLRPAMVPGVKFASKTLLEIAIVLLGASISFATISHSGPALIAMAVVIVLLSLMISYGIGRLMGLSKPLATLVACGNSICGNSAIVAAGPVIDARPADVAASISFTAALGVVVVVLLPLIFPATGLSEWQYGIVAGMTVYAVPQVLAATVPVGALSVQAGTIVKLLRVLMLGPVILLLGLRGGRSGERRASLKHLVPWFIIGFLAMMALRSTGLIPTDAIKPLGRISSVLTIVSMAALGLSVDLRTVAAAGGRVLLAGILSLAALASMSTLALHLIPAISAASSQIPMN